MKYLDAITPKLKEFFGAIWHSRARLIIDTGRRVGNHKLNGQSALTSYSKEEISRRYILERSGNEMKFLDVGARDGRLKYLLGIEKNLNFKTDFYRQNRKIFDSKYSYFGLDLFPEDDFDVIVGDVCNKFFWTKTLGPLIPLMLCIATMFLNIFTILLLLHRTFGECVKLAD